MRSREITRELSRADLAREGGWTTSKRDHARSCEITRDNARSYTQPLKCIRVTPFFGKITRIFLLVDLFLTVQIC